MKRRILITGGAGYIGSRLVPHLLEQHEVTVIDPLWFEAASRRFLDSLAGNDNFHLVRGDIRDRNLVERVLRETKPEAVIHLAAVSNDPSSHLDPDLTREINLEATSDLMRLARQRGVKRFLNASSASVYGVKETTDVTEDLPLEPMTIYARYKAETETVLNDLTDGRFCGVSVRSATVCGYAPRMRLDLTINILTWHAVTKGRIRVFGGSQMRPNIHIDDLVDFYTLLLDADPAIINGRAFNVSRRNATVLELAEMVRENIDPSLPIDVEPTDDERSYHLSATRAREELGYTAVRPLAKAIREVREALADGRIPSPEDPVYRNVVIMEMRPEIYTLESGRAR